MESIFMNEIFKQAPTLGVLVFIVWIFLKHIKEYHIDIKEVTKKCNETIQENTLMMGETKECLKGVNYTLKRMNGRVE